MKKVRYEDATTEIRALEGILRSASAEAFRRENAKKLIPQIIATYHRATPRELDSYHARVLELLEEKNHPDTNKKELRPKIKELKKERRERFPKIWIVCPITGHNPQKIDDALAELSKR